MENDLNIITRVNDKARFITHVEGGIIEKIIPMMEEYYGQYASKFYGKSSGVCDLDRHDVWLWANHTVICGFCAEYMSLERMLLPGPICIHDTVDTRKSPDDTIESKMDFIRNSMKLVNERIGELLTPCVHLYALMFDGIDSTNDHILWSDTCIPDDVIIDVVSIASRGTYPTLTSNEFIEDVKCVEDAIIHMFGEELGNDIIKCGQGD